MSDTVLHQEPGTGIRVAHNSQMCRTAVTMVTAQGDTVTVVLDQSAFIETVEWMDQGELHLSERHMMAYLQHQQRRLQRAAAWHRWRSRLAVLALFVAILTTILIVWGPR